MICMTQDSWGIEFPLPDNFGDVGKEWTEGRSVVWKALQIDAKIYPPTKFEDHAPNYGWWIGLVDLLTFAGGADDVAQYLRDWRAARYETSTRLQRFIQKNWGDSVAVLEIFLFLSPHARETIFHYVNQCRGKSIAEETDLSPGDEDIRLNGASYVRPALRSDRDRKLAKALFSGLEIADQDFLSTARPSGGDSAHLSPHFTFEWEVHSAELEDRETIEFRDAGSALLSLRTYAGWYAKLHTLRREFERDQETAGDFERVVVEIAGLGAIGCFVFDNARQCFVLEGEEQIRNELTSSPTYGFSLTEQMSEKLHSILDYHDSWEDGPLEQVDLQVREEVGLAHSLTYEIGGGEKQDQHWTRIDGRWQEGFMIPEGIHHKRCTKALVDKGKLDHTVPWHQAVLLDTVVYPVSPWAVDLVVALWDRGNPVGRIIGELAGMDPEQVVSPPSENDASAFSQELAEYVMGLPKFSSAHEELATASLVAWIRGGVVTANELLTSIENAESFL